MARATYVYIVETADGRLIPFTVKFQMIYHAKRLDVKRVWRTKDSQPDYQQIEMPREEWDFSDDGV